MIKTWQQRCEERPDHEGIDLVPAVEAKLKEKNHD
jgi:hypothetical protein